jgi:hypothetical protein
MTHIWEELPTSSGWIYQTIRRQILEDSHLHNVKSSFTSAIIIMLMDCMYVRLPHRKVCMHFGKYCFPWCLSVKTAVNYNYIHSVSFNCSFTLKLRDNIQRPEVWKKFLCDSPDMKEGRFLQIACWTGFIVLASLVSPVCSILSSFYSLTYAKCPKNSNEKGKQNTKHIKTMCFIVLFLWFCCLSYSISCLFL